MITQSLVQISFLFPLLFLQIEGLAQRPNIIYIMTDDMGYGDLSCYGQTKFTTPNLDKLASQGVSFVNAYAAAPVCTPTRVAFMTGRYPARTPVGLLEPLRSPKLDIAYGLMPRLNRRHCYCFLGILYVKITDSKNEYIWNMDLMTLIKEKYSEFIDLCRSHKVDKIYAFGSSITDQFDQYKSDIDLIVKVDINDPVDRGEALHSLWDKLEALFKRKVDLLTEESIRNPYLKASIDRTKKLIYDGEGEKSFCLT
jgi:predicted nucleotidyltransferase